MNTLFTLMAEFDGRAVVPIEEVATKYLGLNNKTKINAKARASEFPFPVFRAEKSQKAPWLVSLIDLAEHLDQEREKARQDFEKIHA